MRYENTFQHKFRTVLIDTNTNTRKTMIEQLGSEMNELLQKTNTNNSVRKKIEALTTILKENQNTSKRKFDFFPKVSNLFQNNGIPKNNKKFAVISSITKSSPHGQLTIEDYKEIFPNGVFFQSQKEIINKITELIDTKDYTKASDIVNTIQNEQKKREFKSTIKYGKEQFRISHINKANKYIEIVMNLAKRRKLTNTYQQFYLKKLNELSFNMETKERYKNKIKAMNRAAAVAQKITLKFKNRKIEKANAARKAAENGKRNSTIRANAALEQAKVQAQKSIENANEKAKEATIAAVNNAGASKTRANTAARERNAAVQNAAASKEKANTSNAARQAAEQGKSNANKARNAAVNSAAESTQRASVAKKALAEFEIEKNEAIAAILRLEKQIKNSNVSSSGATESLVAAKIELNQAKQSLEKLSGTSQFNKKQISKKNNEIQSLQTKLENLVKQLEANKAAAEQGKSNANKAKQAANSRAEAAEQGKSNANKARNAARRTAAAAAKESNTARIAAEQSFAEEKTKATEALLQLKIEINKLKNSQNSNTAHGKAALQKAQQELKEAKQTHTKELQNASKGKETKIQENTNELQRLQKNFTNLKTQLQVEVNKKAEKLNTERITAVTNRNTIIEQLGIKINDLQTLLKSEQSSKIRVIQGVELTVKKQLKNIVREYEEVKQRKTNATFEALETLMKKVTSIQQLWSKRKNTKTLFNELVIKNENNTYRLKNDTLWKYYIHVNKLKYNDQLKKYVFPNNFHFRYVKNNNNIHTTRMKRFLISDKQTQKAHILNNKKFPRNSVTKYKETILQAAQTSRKILQNKLKNKANAQIKSYYKKNRYIEASQTFISKQRKIQKNLKNLEGNISQSISGAVITKFDPFLLKIEQFITILAKDFEYLPNTLNNNKYYYKKFNKTQTLYKQRIAEVNAMKEKNINKPKLRRDAANKYAYLNTNVKKFSKVMYLDRIYKIAALLKHLLDSRKKASDRQKERYTEFLNNVFTIIKIIDSKETIKTRIMNPKLEETVQIKKWYTTGKDIVSHGHPQKSHYQLRRPKGTSARARQGNLSRRPSSNSPHNEEEIRENFSSNSTQRRITSVKAKEIREEKEKQNRETMQRNTA